MPETNSEHRPAARPSFAAALRFWFRLGFINFGGPAGQIAIMHTELVERRRWIGERQFLHALNYCMLLPGPEAQQLATYCGWLLHRTWGGIAAGALFVLPSVVILWALSYVYVVHGQLPWITAIFHGLKPAVVGIVAVAVLHIGRKALRNAWMWTIATAAFVAIFVLRAPFPAIVLGAGLIGLVGAWLAPATFTTLRGHAHDDPPERNASQESAPRPTLARSARVIAICLLLWWTPMLLVALWLGRGHTLWHEGLFFSKAALVTFGGAYAVLPYVAQQAVERYDWLAPGQMMDGLGLAESTPGPLIMVLQFVGFLGGWNHPGDLPPLLAATLGALLTTWVTFVPCFLWIFLGAPYIERLRNVRLLTGALSTITAAIVGVVLNLAVWFGMHVLWPDGGRVDAFALAVTLVVVAGLLRWKWNIVAVILGAGAAGLLHGWLQAAGVG